MSLLISYLVFSLYRERISLYFLVPIYLAVVFSVPVGLYNIVLWKDIPFALLVVFWAYTLSIFYRKRRSGPVTASLQQIAALFLLYLALGLVRHNGLVYLVVIPLLLISLRIVSIRRVALALGMALVLGISLFFLFRSKMPVDDAKYLVEMSTQYLKPVADASFKKELVRTSREYWGILNINQTRTKWDLWHYYLGDRQAYWFLRHSGWYDVYPYLSEKPPLFPWLRDLGLKMYWNSYKTPWVYLSWNPVFMLVLFPLTIILCRWLPMSAIFSGFILIQVVALLSIINILNWRYYYFVYLSGYFLPLLLLWDYRFLTMRNATTGE